MAFLDLEEGIAELFDPSDRYEDRTNAWLTERAKWAKLRRKAWQAERTITDRLARKRNRSLADRRQAPPLPREVSCVFCRVSFALIEGLAHHTFQKHGGAFPLVTRAPRVACRICRLERTGYNSLTIHYATAHQLEHAAASLTNSQLAGRYRYSLTRRAIEQAASTRIVRTTDKLGRPRGVAYRRIT